MVNTHDAFAAPAQLHLPLADRATGLIGSIIDSSTSLLAAQQHDVISFAMGSPADEMVPLAELKDIASQVFDYSSFSYGATEGEPVLIDALLDQLANTPDASTAERLTITAGGMQGLDLACKIFLNPGDLVIVESPTYTNGSATALGYGAELLEAPMDDDGLIVEALPELVAATGKTPKAIYTIPNFQNPSGTTLSLPRRELLLEFAHQWNAVIIDDDPYGLLRFQGTDVPSLRELSPADPLIFSVRTFSKILAPGLRVGWVDTAPELQQLIINAKQAMDTCTNVPQQHLVAEFIRRGRLEAHLHQLRTEYRSRKESMQRILREALGERVSFTDPAGGFFLWLTLVGHDAPISTTALFETALAEGVAFIPGSAFSTSGAFDNALRLCYATTDEPHTVEGITRLARALDKQQVLDQQAPQLGEKTHS